MPQLRKMLDDGSVRVHAYGTSEGVEKAWDSRGRGRHEQVLEKHGYSEFGKSSVGSKMYSHNKDSNNRISVAKDGSWRHMKKGSGEKSVVGKSADDLEKHLGGKTPSWKNATDPKAWHAPQDDDRESTEGRYGH